MPTAVAKETGFYDGARIRKGQRFTVKEGDKAKWFTLAKEPTAATKPEAAKPATKPTTAPKPTTKPTVAPGKPEPAKTEAPKPDAKTDASDLA